MNVAPHEGAWIETGLSHLYGRGLQVAPHEGAWIETAVFLPSNIFGKVAPHEGAWIETIPHPMRCPLCRRTPRGCVD